MNNELPQLRFLIEPAQLALRLLALNTSNAERNAIASLIVTCMTGGYQVAKCAAWELNISHDFAERAIELCRPGEPFKFPEELSNVAVKKMRATLKEAIDARYTNPCVDDWVKWCLYQGFAVTQYNQAIIPLEARYHNGKTIEASLFINPPKEYS